MITLKIITVISNFQHCFCQLQYLEREQLTVLWPCSTWWRIQTKWRTQCWRCVCFRALSPRTAIYSEREGGKTWSWRTRNRGGKRMSVRIWTVTKGLMFQFVSRIELSVDVSVSMQFGKTVYSHTFVDINIDLHLHILHILHNSAFRQARCISSCQWLELE